MSVLCNVLKINVPRKILTIMTLYNYILDNNKTLPDNWYVQ